MQMKLPGTEYLLDCERTEDQRLVRLSAGGRLYIEQVDGERVFDSGFVRVRDALVAQGLLRHIVSPSESWTEQYLLGHQALVTHIDGVEIQRDERYRIVTCGEWLYGYSGDGLSIVEGPHGTRRVARSSDGRPFRVNGVAIPYDVAGKRGDIGPLPPTHHRDEFGRLWTITAPDGRLLTTYLWDGFACLGRIDGPPGEPLAAVFSLDPSRTPVRVILRDRVIRIPRDAFGEGLLAHAGVPGLHCGLVYNGYVHYRSRVLDPRVASYDRPDPYHGGPDDPRRRDGHIGALPVERARSGPYAACQYDPISYVDPTGENTGMTLLLLLSDFTWSLQHNLAGWFGLDFTLNWWIDFFSIVKLPEFFEFEGFHSDRTGRFGTRRGGVFSGNRVFTYQHQMFGNAAAFDDLRQTQLFDPRGRFEPALYGSLLRAEPEGAGAFLLQGNLDNRVDIVPWQWSRAGGRAEPVAPGLPVPYFPLGGLHFDTVFRALLGPRACTVTELRPSDDTPVVATVAQTTAFVDFTTAASGVAAGDEVLLTDSATAVDIKTVAAVTPQGSGSRVRFTDAVTTVANTGVRLRGLGVPTGAETLSTVGPAGRLNVAATSGAYTVNDPLQLSQDGVAVGAALIRSLEAQLQIDGALPPPPPGAVPLEVRTVLEAFGGNATLAGNTLTQAGSSPLPAVDAPIVLRGSGQARGAVVVPNPDPDVRQLDRTVVDLAPLGSNVTWNPVASPTTIGQATAIDAGATLTYNPGAVRTAPATGALLVTGTGYRAVRVVSGLTYDAIVISNASPPGNPVDPYQVERFVTEAPELTNGTLGTQTGLTLSPGVTLAGIALQLRALNAPNIAAAGLITNATLSGATATLVSPTAPIATPLNPSDLVVLQDAATNTLELAVVGSIQVTVQLDRAINAPGPDLRLVELGDSGFLYNATHDSDNEMTVLPTANGANNVQMPRFRAGEIVLVNGTLLYRLADVNGTTLTLEDGTAILPPDPLTVQRMVPVNPTFPPTGTPWVGDSGSGSGNSFTFRTWAPNSAPAGMAVGIVSLDPNAPANNVTRPATIAARTQVQIVFTAAPSNVGANVSINAPNLAGGVDTFYLPSFTQSGVDLTVANVLPGPLPAGNNLLVAIPFEATGVSARGQLTAGNVLCPNDPENWEFDRRQSLAEHELTHTCQSATWGPLYMGYLPLFVLEGASELFTDVELPEFSQFVNGEIIAAEGRRQLRIPSFNNIDFSEGVRVQVSSDRFTPRTITLGTAGDNNMFALGTDISLSAGPVSVRRQTGSSFWTGLRDVVYNALHILTLGGVLNLVAGGVWGGLIFGIGKLWFFMSRRWFGMGQEYPATIADDRRTVTMTTPVGRLAVQGFNEVILRSASDSGVREVESITGETLRLRQDCEFTGEARVVPYKSHDISDWHDYFNATVPESARPASIQIEAKANGDTLTLHPFDRVTIAHGTTTFRTNVTAVPSPGVAELEQAPASTPLRIAKVDENDPIGSADSRHLTEMGVGWLRWFFDPYAQFQLRLHPERNSWQDILARIARYGFSSHSWSAAIPGSLFFNNLFSQPNNGHQTPFEQEASSESGNVYSPLSVLRGSFAKAGFATYNAMVGDIGRFWHVPLHDFGTPRVPIVVIITNKRDAPGSHLQLWPRIMPLPNGNPAGPLSTADTNEPNTGVVPTDPNPGRFVPDALTDKNTITAGNPDAPTQAGPVSFGPSDLAFIPTSAALNQTVGCYVSFTRPGTHRLTVQDGLLTNWQGRDAQQVGVQALWFDIVVADVTVTAAGQPIATADPPPTFTLVLLQRAEISVAESENRQYALTVTRPGPIVSTEGLALIAGTTTGTETVEVSRFYAFTGGAYTDAVLSQHGMHLPGDLHIPLRIFSVTVGNTLPLRDGPEPASAVVTTRNPAQPGFLLVPVSADAPPAITSVTYPGGATPGIRDPQFTSDTPTPSAAARTFLGPQGVIFRIPFDDPPEETADLTLTVTVRSGAETAPLTGTVQVIPHFRLQHAAGTFRVQPGTEIELTCEGGVPAADANCTGDGIVGIIMDGPSIRINFRPDATPGFRTVTAADGNDTTHRARRTIEVTA